MARDSREILSAVRLETQVIEGPNVTTTAKTYGPDDKDELAQAATPDQLRRLLKLKAINGDWGVTVEEEEPPAPAPVVAPRTRNPAS